MAQLTTSSIVASTTQLHDAGFQLPVTAGNIFCQVTPPAGNYFVQINRIAYGTGNPSIANNSHFAVGATNYTLSTGAILGVEYRYEFYVTVDGSTPLQVVANGNGSANIGVSAGITATRLA